MSFSRLKPKRRPPFVVVYKAVARNPKISLAARAVFTILKSYANSDGTHCFPSIKKLMEGAGCPRRTLDRHLEELRIAGLIHGTQRKTATGKLSSTDYMLYDDTHARVAYKPPKSTSRNGARRASKVAHGEGAKIVPFTEETQALG